MPVVPASRLEGHVADDHSLGGEHVQIAVAHEVLGIRRIRPAAREHFRDVVHGCHLGLVGCRFDGFGDGSAGQRNTQTCRDDVPYLYHGLSFAGSVRRKPVRTRAGFRRTRLRSFMPTGLNTP